jgi:hypothetical protein
VKSQEPQNCPEHEAVGHLLMFSDIKEFDWDHTDEFRNNSCWPGDSSNEPGGSLIHSNQWMSSTMGNAFAERLKHVLTNCQPYPGDSESKTNISVSHFLILVPEKDLFTIHDMLSRHVSTMANPKVRQLTSTVLGRLCSSALRCATQ